MAQQAATNDIRPGMKLEIDGQPYVVVLNDFYKPGKGQAINKIKVKHLLDGRVIDKSYKSGTKIDLADIHETKMRMLYREAEGIVFMHDETFEQVTISNSNLEGVDQWLLDDRVYDVILYNGEPVAVEPPTFIELRITETEPGAKGNTASGRVLKPSTVESGAKVQVPIFIEEGEIIKIDTRNGEYVSRVKE